MNGGCRRSIVPDTAFRMKRPVRGLLAKNAKTVQTTVLCNRPPNGDPIESESLPDTDETAQEKEAPETARGDRQAREEAGERESRVGEGVPARASELVRPR